MAYVALSSLMYTLEQLSKPYQSLACRSRTQRHVQSIHQNLSDLQVFLHDATKEAKDVETLKFIEKRIRDVVYKAEDKVDSSLRSIILEDCIENIDAACNFFEEELLKVEKDVDSLRKEVMQIDVNKHGSKSAELATTPSSPEKSAIVGMEDDFNTILDCITSQTDELTVIPIFGMGGIGKTTLARKVYNDSSIRSRFDKHAWATISEEYNERQMLLEVVSSITGSNQEMSDDQLMETVYRGLKGRRFLIIIDDIWSTEAWDQMQRIFPNDDNKSRILLTTRLKYVADYVSSHGFPPHCKSFLSVDDSWNLFTEKVFKKDPCPPHLQETGKHIVQQCQGLPLSVVVVAGLLGKMDPTHDNWKKIEEDLNSLFGTVSELCQSILSLSYSYLPQHLRACFLYVGGFPEDREIDVSKLIRLWIAEQFVKARSNKRLEVVAEEYLQELIDRSLILTGRRRADGRMKTFKIHDLLRQLCLSEAHTENVVNIMNGNVPEAMYDQRRVILLSDLQEKQICPTRHTSGITRTFVSMKSFGSKFPKGIFSIFSQFKLLKVLDVISIWDDFSWIIPQLVHLRYVAARIEEALSLAKLRNLQTIILESIPPKKLKYPLDIWSMSEIRHVNIIAPLSDLQEKQICPTRHTSGITRTFVSMKSFGSKFPKGIFSIFSQFKLLKVLDVISIWDDFSWIIPQLVHLRYVAARIEEALSLAKLRNLQTIILESIPPKKLKYPLDIWSMSEIRHVNIIAPLYISNSLEAENPLFLNKLHTLYLHHSPFVAEIIRRTPNLKKLKIIDGFGHPDWTTHEDMKTESTNFPPNLKQLTLTWEETDTLILLEKLETLHIAVQILSVDIFPPNLKKLTLLGGVSLLWEDMNLLANLPNLEVLKGYCVFKGRRWKLNEDVVFRKLKYLLIIGGDLQRWEAGSDNFPMLEQLSLHGLKQLEEIPESIEEIMTLKLIEIQHCSSGVETSAKRIQQEQQSWGNYELRVQIAPKPYSPPHQFLKLPGISN